MKKNNTIHEQKRRFTYGVNTVRLYGVVSYAYTDTIVHSLYSYFKEKVLSAYE